MTHTEEIALSTRKRRRLGSYHGHHERLLLLVQDGDEQRFLSVASGQSCVEVHDVRVVVIITDAVVLPPAEIVSTVKGCEHKQSHTRRDQK